VGDGPVSFDEEIVAYYGRGQERDRLSGPARLEFVRTQDLLARHLPGPPAVIVDVGGGPGTYARWLTGLGYDPVRRETLLRAIRRVEAEPTMIGASPHLLALARRA
jgi:hypothetical protein